MSLNVLGMLMDTLNYPDQPYLFLAKSNLEIQQKFCLSALWGPC
jgi:hypothetical protein